VETFDADGGNAAFTLLKLETHSFAFIELAQPSVLHGADMHENIISPRIGGDEPVALAGVEPLHHARKRSFGAFLVFLHRSHFDTFLGPVVPDIRQNRRQWLPADSIYAQWK
jgi:hypothetical protein